MLCPGGNRFGLGVLVRGPADHAERRGLMRRGEVGEESERWGIRCSQVDSSRRCPPSCGGLST